jgi:cyclohexanecarboxylate-CoA ligase
MTETLFAAFTQNARSRPDACAVVEGVSGQRFSYARLAADVGALADRLATLGDLNGRVASVQLPNSYGAVVVDLAVLSLGAVLNPLLPNYRHAELANVTRVADPAIVFTPAVYRRFAYAEMIRSVISETGAGSAHIEVGDEGVTRLPERIEPPQRALHTASSGEPLSELIFTSGTQAEPKAILHTEATINANVEALAAALSLTHDDVIWVPSPIGHSTGLNFGVREALYLGATAVLQDVWNGSAAAEMVARERCTYTLAAVTFLRDLMDAARAQNRDVSSMRAFACGGAPVPPFMVDEAQAMGVGVLRLYGSTEGLVMTCHRPDAPLDHRRRTDGPPLPGVEMATIDEAGQLQGDGVRGEIVTRGPQVCAGRLVDGEYVSPLIDAAGWMRTEDVGVVDAFGELEVVGRMKEIIIRGGMNISSREIEEAILAINRVADAAVVGIADPRLGEHACAFVVLRPGEATMTLSELTDALRAAGLAIFKLPEQIECIDDMPRTPTGKVQKFRLHELLAERASATAPVTGTTA